jgi:hypothetical protein
MATVTAITDVVPVFFRIACHAALVDDVPESLVRGGDRRQRFGSARRRGGNAQGCDSEYLDQRYRAIRHFNFSPTTL